MSDVILNKSNTILFFGSCCLAFFYQLLAYLKIEEAQAITLVMIFSFSGLVGFIRTLALNEGLRCFMVSDLLGKILMVFVPFLMAFIAEYFHAFYLLVDYTFSFLIIGEFISILVCIQSIKSQKKIESVDFYNLFVNKVKQMAIKALRLESLDMNRHVDTPADKPQPDTKDDKSKEVKND